MKELYFRYETRILLAAAALFAVSPLVARIPLTSLALLGVVAMISFFRPEIGIAAVVASIPVQSEFMLAFVRGSFTYTQVCMFGLLIGWGVHFWKYRIWLDAVLIGFGLMLAAWMNSFRETDSLSLFVEEFYRWAIAGVFYVICRSVLRDWRTIRWPLWGSTVGLIGVSLYALYQFLFHRGPDQLVVGGAMRVFGTFGTPNTLAAYTEFTTPILLCVILYSVFRRKVDAGDRLLVLAMSVACALGMVVEVLTQSRGGWIGMAAAMGVIFLVIPRRLQFSAVAVLLLLMGALALTDVGRSQYERFGRVFNQEEAAQRGESTFDYGTGRSAIWEAAIEMIKDKPTTGVGAGEFDYHFRDYVLRWFDRWPKGQAHDGWLQTGATAGVPGMLAFTAWLAASIWACLSARFRAQTDLSKWIALGGLAVMVAFAVHNLVDYLNVLSLGLQLSMVTAVAQGMVPDPLTRYATQGAPEMSVSQSLASS